MKICSLTEPVAIPIWHLTRVEVITLVFEENTNVDSCTIVYNVENNCLVFLIKKNWNEE